MSGKQLDQDQLLDQALAEIRDETMAPEAEKAAASRVWDAVRMEADKQHEASPAQRHIRDCADFQALVPAYLQSALSDARALLFEDHMRECVPCRRALKSARAAKRPATPAARATSRGPGWVSKLGWRAAAAAAIFLAVAGLSFNTGVLKIRSGGVIHIDSIEGELFRVTDDNAVPVRSGEQIKLEPGEALRTAKGSRAMIRLADASAVEMNERSEVGIYDEAWLWNRSEKDAVLALERGNLIVEASDQGSGHLFVETDDSTTAVTGTVFAVNKGIKGTRVSVLEGEVHVDHTGTTDVLHPGMQTTTQPGLSLVPLADEIAWSGNFDRHIQLLHDLTELGREIDRVLTPGLRYSTELLDLTPEDTVVYISVPNVSGSLGEAEQILDDKIAASEALQEWWQANVIDTGHESDLRELVDRVQAYGEILGDEIVLSMRLKADHEVEEPLVLAKLDSPDRLRDLLEEDLAKAGADAGVLMVEGDRPDFSGKDADMFLWTHDGLLAVAFERESIQQLAGELLMDAKRPEPTGMRAKLADRYEDGVEWLVGVDMGRILEHTAANKQEAAEMRGFGLLDMQHLIGERRAMGERTENRVVLSFSQTRRGVAAWLDEPAPMGSLDFVSPNATLAAGFVMQEPATLVDELLETIGSFDDGFEAELAAFEAEHGISIRDDIAAPLGGEVAFALDGPLLPTPSWKLIVEVYNPDQLQQTLEWAIGELNAVAQAEGHQGAALTSDSDGDREVWQLESLDTGISVYYTFTDGYMVVGPSRAVLSSALQTRDSGVTLARSGEFLDMLPQDGEINFSGVVYQNLGTLLGPLARLGQATAKLSPEQAELAEAMSRNSKPSLTTAYGAPDRITFVYTHEGGFLTSSLSSFFSFQSLTGMQELIGQSLRQ